MVTTSFFPAKPLGCYGDGGCIFTDDDRLADTLRSLRVHGQGEDKYDNVRIGMNGRLDTLQAAILLEKLKIFPDEIVARQNVAARYDEGLRGVVRRPEMVAGATSVWAQYTIVLEHHDRDAVAAVLDAEGIPTAVYYRKPLHLQPAYRRFPTVADGLPTAELLSKQVLSLPLHPYLDVSTQQIVIQAVRAASG